MSGAMTRATKGAVLSVIHESWPIRGSFTISRGARTSAEVVVVAIARNGVTGRGESVPYARYGESVESVIAAIEAIAPEIARGLTIDDLQALMPPGAARKAVDCALWDLAAKESGVPVWRLAGLPAPRPVVTAFTLSIDDPAAMEQAAQDASRYPLLKVKLGTGDIAEDQTRLLAVRRGAPQSRLIVDANEAWSMGDLDGVSPALQQAGVALVEQPLPAEADGALAGFQSPVPLCADESCHDSASLDALVGRYDMVNIKLNKTGGLTEAIRLQRAARAAGLDVMVGCMVGTSLAMAPTALIAGDADFVDLDGPLLLARDRMPGIAYENGVMSPPKPELWG